MIHLLGLTAHPPQSYRQQRGRQWEEPSRASRVCSIPLRASPGVQHTIKGQSRCEAHQVGVQGLPLCHTDKEETWPLSTGTEHRVQTSYI